MTLDMVEKLVLLSINNENGRVSRYGRYVLKYGVAGGILLHLYDQGAITPEKKGFVVSGKRPDGSRIAQAALDSLLKEKKEYPVKRWILFRSSATKAIRKEAFYRLEDKGIVREDEYRFLGLFPLKCYPVTNTVEKEKMANKLREVLMEGSPPEIEEVYILGLLAACRAEYLLVSKQERKAVKEKLKGILKGNYLSSGNEFLLTVLKSVSTAVAYERSQT